MSLYFEIDSQTVWTPASRVGWLYLEQLKGTASILGISPFWSGMEEDEVRLAREELGALVRAAGAEMLHTNHPVLLRLLDVVIGPAIVMLKRAGHDFAGLPGIGQLPTSLELWAAGMPA